MPKGYWIVNNAVHDAEGYERYKVANAAPLKKFKAKFLVRGGIQEAREGTPYPRTVVLEFPSYKDAVACYESPEYQAAIGLRTETAEGTLTIVEGYEP